MNYFIATVSKEHVLIGVKNGIAQAGHGKFAPLKKMKKGDWLIYYSPKIAMDSDEKLQAFTAIGEMVDDDIFQFEMSPDFKPFRRRVKYSKSKDASILPLINDLEFIKDKKRWGFPFRFGLFKISEHDFELIKKEMMVN